MLYCKIGMAIKKQKGLMDNSEVIVGWEEGI